MITTCRSAVTVLPPPVTVTLSGYVSAAASAGGVALTVMFEVLPAVTLVLVACASPAGLAVTVQPSGPVASIENVASTAVWLWIVMLNV